MRFYKIKLALLLIVLTSILMEAKPYKGAELRTNDSFLYGRFEVRWRSAPGSGLLSSFFTFHDTPILPQQWNEIDIENLGRYSDQTQFNIITQWQVNHEVIQPLQYDPHQDFHVYAIEWTPDYVAWFVDGFEIYREIASHVQQLIYPQKNMMNIWPPTNSDWAGVLDSTILPVYAYYDWVKYYNYTPGVNGNFTLSWSDEFDGWNQARWSKGNHTWNGNNADLIPQNAVFQDGYLILCLTTANAIGYNGDPVEDSDVTAPYMIWARTYPDHIKVFFSEPVDPASAENIDNYIIPSLNITNASLIDNRTVRLEVDNIDPLVSYNLIASGIRDLAQPPNTMSTQVMITKKPLLFPIHINIGGESWQDYLNDQVYTAELEYGFTGGNVVVHPDSLQFDNTNEDAVYRSELRDITFYQIRLPEGIYRITLMFAETQYNSPSSRIFDVYAEDQLVVDDLNIYGEAGFNMYYAVEKIVDNLQIDDGILDLYFESSVGEPVLSGIKVEAIPSAISQVATIPENIKWFVYPNPFNPTTTIQYHLDKTSPVKIDLYNLRGQFVKELLSAPQSSGTHQIQFDARTLSSGIYFLKLKVGDQFTRIKKIVYLK